MAAPQITIADKSRVWRSFTIKSWTQEVRESYLKTFFNLMYYLFFVPFKVESNGIGGNYILKSNKIQKVICALICIELLGSTIVYFLSNFSHFFDLTSDISQVLATIGNLSGSIMALTATKVVWLRQKCILKFLNASRVGSFPKHSMSQNNMKLLIVVMTLWMFSTQIICSYLDTTLLKSMNSTSTWMNYITSGKENMTLEILGKILSQFLKLIFIQGVVLYMMPRLLLIVLLLQLKGLGLQFEEYLEKEEVKLFSPVEKVMEEYEKLKRTVDCANSWAGGILLSIYVCILAFLATLPGILRDESEAQMGRWGHFSYSALIGIFLFVACDLPKRVRTSMKKWIAIKRHQKGLSRDDKLLLLALSQENDCGEPLGLSCSFFTITYSYFGSMIGLLTTYGVIVFQMHK